MAKRKLTKQARFLRRLCQLHARTLGSNQQERETAYAKLLTLLEENKKTPNDVQGLLAEAVNISDVGDEADERGGLTAGGDVEQANALQAIVMTLEAHCDLKPHEYIAVALWILHTFFFDRFSISPRLALTSPVNGCGKTTLLLVIKQLSYRPTRTDNATPAALYKIINNHRGTLLVDEADNAGLRENGLLKTIFNSGHLKGGNTLRVIRDEVVAFSTFAPLAIAAIGTLPMPLLRRSVVCHLERTSRTDLERFDMQDEDTTRIVDAVYRMALDWQRSDPKLTVNPNLPKQLKNRVADNWRPLISIADSFGEAWGEKARDAAITFASVYHDEDAAVILLNDLREIFGRTNCDRAASQQLIAELHDLADGMWLEYRGVRDDQPPRKLTPAEMARLLRPFGIKPCTVWPPGGRNEGGKSRKGYYRQQFEQAWARYCSADGTPAHASKIKHLA